MPRTNSSSIAQASLVYCEPCGLFVDDTISYEQTPHHFRHASSIEDGGVAHSAASPDSDDTGALFDVETEGFDSWGAHTGPLNDGSDRDSDWAAESEESDEIRSQTRSFTGDDVDDDYFDPRYRTLSSDEHDSGLESDDAQDDNHELHHAFDPGTSESDGETSDRRPHHAAEHSARAEEDWLHRPGDGVHGKAAPVGEVFNVALGPWFRRKKKEKPSQQSQGKSKRRKLDVELSTQETACKPRRRKKGAHSPAEVDKYARLKEASPPRMWTNTVDAGSLPLHHPKKAERLV